MIKIIKMPSEGPNVRSLYLTAAHREWFNNPLLAAIAKIRLEESKKVRRLGENVPHAQNLQPII